MNKDRKLKRKISYGLLTILFTGGLYLGLRFAFGLFTPLNFITARKDIKNGKIQIVVLGEHLPTDKQRQNLAKIYGFNFYFMGDNLSREIINGTLSYNKTMVNYLEKNMVQVGGQNFKLSLTASTRPIRLRLLILTAN